MPIGLIDPTGMLLTDGNPPAPSPYAMLTELPVWFAVAKSRLPSSSKSATTMPFGLLPTVMKTGAWNVPLPLPRRSATRPAVLASVTTTSTMPSSLKSPSADMYVLVPAAKDVGEAKAPPRPSSPQGLKIGVITVVCDAVLSEKSGSA